MSDFGTWRLEQINPAEISATDLHDEAQELIAQGTQGVEAYILHLWTPEGKMYPEGAEVLFVSYGRAGIAWGADAQWTDARSPEDAAERWINDKMVN